MANDGYIIMGGHWRGTPVPVPKTAQEYLQQQLEKRPEHAAMQRAKLATHDEKARAGIDAMVRDHKESAAQAGVEKTDSELRNQMTRVAERANKKGIVK